MQELILFLLSYLVVFIAYQIFIIKPIKNTGKKKRKKEKKEPTEVVYLITKYNLDMDKVNYNQLLQIVALTSSFDIALICSLIMIPENFFIRLLVGLISMIIVILVSYHFVYLFYKKKGMIKDV